MQNNIAATSSGFTLAFVGSIMTWNQVGSAIILGFVGGAAGYLGKLTIDYLKKKYFNKNKKTKK